MRYLCSQQPPSVILENVLGLKGPNLCCALQCLSESGYIAHVEELCTLSFFLPQARRRIYICGLRRDLCHACGISEAYVHDQMAKMFAALQSGNACLSLDDVLLPDTHPAVQRYLDASSGKSHAKNDRDKWVGQHIESAGLESWLSAGVGCMDPELAEYFPGYNELSHRQLDMMQTLGLELPDRETGRVRIANISQTERFCTITENQAPTLTPGGYYLLLDRVRLDCIKEALICQANLWCLCPQRSRTQATTAYSHHRHQDAIISICLQHPVAFGIHLNGLFQSVVLVSYVPMVNNCVN